MTNEELIWRIIEQEFPDYRNALEIYNPLRSPLWDESLELPEQEKLYNQYVDQYDEIDKRYDQLCDFSEEKMEALRMKYGLITKVSDREGFNWQQNKDRDNDDIIGKTAEQLIKWGFARRTIYEELMSPSATILGRTDTYRKALSQDRIEQIHEEWRERVKKYNIERNGVHMSFQRWMYTRQSLVETRPEATLNELIIKLLNDKGECSDHRMRDYYDFSKRAERLMSIFPRLRKYRKK